MNRPNILMVITHDSGRHFGCYGADVETPNIDRIGADGVRFANAFCASPTCSPARASLLTGRYPHRHGLIGLTHRGWRLDPGVPRLPALLAEAGYHTVVLGVHHEEPDAHDMGYRRVVTAESRSLDHVTPKVAEFLASQPPEPFFACVGFSETHRVFSGRSADDPATVRVPGYLPDLPTVCEDLGALAGDIRRVDEAVGRIDVALHEAGLADDTLLIYLPDHGIPFPLAKANCTEAGLGIALLARGPGGFAGGRVLDPLVCSMDLTPTLLELAGVKLPDGLDGRSLLPLLADAEADWPDHLFAEQTYHAGYDPVRSIRTRRFRYIRGFESRPIAFAPNCDPGPTRDLVIERGWHRVERPQEMLYDVTDDADCRRNLADDPLFAATLAELRGRVAEWMERTDDPLLAGRVPMPPNAKLCPAGVLHPEQLEGPDDWRIEQ